MQSIAAEIIFELVIPRVNYDVAGCGSPMEVPTLWFKKKGTLNVVWAMGSIPLPRLFDPAMFVAAVSAIIDSSCGRHAHEDPAFRTTSLL